MAISALRIGAIGVRVAILEVMHMDREAMLMHLGSRIGLLRVLADTGDPGLLSMTSKDIDELLVETKALLDATRAEVG